MFRSCLSRGSQNCYVLVVRPLVLLSSAYRSFRAKIPPWLWRSPERLLFCVCFPFSDGTDSSGTFPKYSGIVV